MRPLFIFVALSIPLVTATACGGDAVDGERDISAVLDTSEVPKDAADAAAEDAGADTEVDAADAADDSVDTIEDSVDTADPDRDQDRDGVPDLAELEAGTDPLDPASAPAWHPEITARPRLYFDGADVPALRALRDGEDGAVLWARILSYADREAPATSDTPWDDGTAQTRAWIAEAAAFVGLLREGADGRPYSEKAAALLAEALVDPTPLNAGLFPDPDNVYDLREAEALVAACHAYDLLAGTPGADDLLAAAGETLTGRVDDFAAIHLESGAFHTFLLLAQNNHLMKVMGALGVCAIALPDRPGAAFEFNEAITTLTYMLLDFQGQPEGGYAEGWNYLAYGGQSWLPLIWAYHRLAADAPWPLKCNGTATLDDPREGETLPYVDLARTDTLRHIFDNALRSARPDGQMVPTDDANVGPLHGAVLAALFDQPAWMWNWRKPAVNRHSSVIPVLSFVVLRTVPEPAPPTFALDSAFPEAGFVNLRSDWGPDATFLHMLVEHGRVRANGLGHEHADSLSILLHAHGEALAIDPGYINFDHHELIKYGKDHNIVLVDGAGPPFPLSVAAPVGDAWLEDWQPDDPTRTTALGRTRYAETSWWRRVVRVDGAWFLVADRLHGDAAHTYTFALNGYGGGDVVDGSFTLAADGATWSRPKASLRAVVVPTEGTATYAERLEEHATVWGHYELHSCLDVQAEEAADAGFLTVLWPAPAGAELPTFSASTPAPGRAEIRLDDTDGTYAIATLELADPPRLSLRCYRTDGTLEREDSWAMATAPDPPE